MDNTVKNILDFFSDRQKSFTSKASIGVIFICTIILIDFSGLYTYNYQVNSKLEQLGKIESLKKKYDKNSVYYLELEKLEKEIISKKHYSQKIENYINNQNAYQGMKNHKVRDDTVIIASNCNDSFKITYQDSNTIKSTKDLDLNIEDKSMKDLEETIIQRKLNKKWMLISSNFLLLLVIPFIIFAPFFDETKLSFSYFIGWIAFGLIWWGIIELITLISFQIPQLNPNPMYNYVLNSIIHLFIVGGLIWSGGKTGV